MQHSQSPITAEGSAVMGAVNPFMSGSRLNSKGAHFTFSKGTGYQHRQLRAMLKAGTKANAIVQKLRRTAGAIYARANKISSPSSTAWLCLRMRSMRRSMNCGDSTKPTNANACRRWSTMRSCNARSRYRRDGFVLRSRQLGSLRRLPLGLNERTDKPCVRKWPRFGDAVA